MTGLLGSAAPGSDPWRRGMNVRLFDWVYRPRGTVPDYVSCSVAWQDLAAGQGELVIAEADPKTELILSADVKPLMVVVDVNGQRWSGRVATFDLNRDDGPPGSGTVSANLVQDWVWLLYMLASQNGADPSLVGMPVNDTQTGPAATLAAYYINAAAARLRVPVIAVAPAVDQSPQITLDARQTPLDELLAGPLAAAGVALPAAIWLPGDPLPAGVKSLDRPTVVFTPQLRPSKPWLRWSDAGGGISKVQLHGIAATGYRATVGLDGQDADRVYDLVVDTDLQAQLGDYALPEVYKDESNATFGVDSQSRGLKDLRDHRPGMSASLEVIDGRPFRFGRHYVCGDLASAQVAGVDLSEPIGKVTVADDRDNGLTFTPLVGDPQAETNDELMVAALASIAQQVRAVQRR